MRLISLRYGDKPIFINVDHISSFAPRGEFGGCEIYMAGNGIKWIVDESCAEVISLIQEVTDG